MSTGREEGRECVGLSMFQGLQHWQVGQLRRAGRRSPGRSLVAPTQALAVPCIDAAPDRPPLLGGTVELLLTKFTNVLTVAVRKGDA